VLFIRLVLIGVLIGMPVASLQELLEAGVHFGHQTKRWNPKMKPFIWGERNGIYIIDLTKTTQLLDDAYNFVKHMAAQGKKIVFVGTKKQAVDIIAEEATRCGAFYINKRWLGGTLTNFDTIRTRINRLRELEEMMTNGHFALLQKKEVAVLTREFEKLNRTLGGVKDMRGMPDMIFVVDQKREEIAVEEANKAKVPVVAIVDTNCDPQGVDYVIPGNDDAIRAIKLITVKIADAIIEGRESRKKQMATIVAGSKATTMEEAMIEKATHETAKADEGVAVGVVATAPGVDATELAELIALAPAADETL
jgi:small subunit ribosomal protein S2